jgi:4-hydroxy-tetrahydrodipicolinate synthase
MHALRGSITAIITPFKGGEIDWKAFDAFIEWQIASGSHGLVACGTTGESPTLTHDEHRRILERAVAVVKGRIPLIAGTGSNCTRKTAELTKHAQTIGADAALVVTPYYNKPTQEGLYQHYKAVAQSVSLPVIIYNIPGRCVVDMKPETMARARTECANIIGVKDATGDLTRVKQTAAACGADFLQFSGEDGLIADFLKEGGHGCISVTSNAAPAECAALHDAWKSGDRAKFDMLDKKLAPLHKALFVETSPAPIKYTCSRLGLCTDEVRLPMVPASQAARKAVDEAMEAAGLLSPHKPGKLHAHG